MKNKSPTKWYKINENDWVKIWYTAIDQQAEWNALDASEHPALDVPSAVFTAGPIDAFYTQAMCLACRAICHL